MRHQLNVGKPHLATLQELLKEFLPHAEVWAYGSRVTGRSTDISDLDMVVFATKEQTPAVYALQEALDESYLPFRVDLFVWDSLPESFHATIQKGYVVLQKP